MRIKFILIYIIITGLTALVKSQDTVPALITDRPDQTESSTVVPLKSLQIETGFVMEKDETNLVRQQSFAYNTTLLRYGLLENFELRLGLEYLGEKIEIKNTDTLNTLSGLSPMYTGFKVKIANEDGWKPEIAFLGGLVLPFTANEDFKPEYPAADIRFSFAHTLTDRLSLGYNLGAEWDGNTAVPGYFYSLALGIGITDKLGMYIESYGLVPGEGDAEYLADAGITWLTMPNFQLDISGGLGINEKTIDNFISFGLSYRIPN
ncbi:MAG: transporter [Alphaproteobacteria bacterium]|nr:MAG: transporter [Alphaproteobacteria bacterium]